MITLDKRLLTQKTSQCLKSVLFTEPAIDDAVNPFDKDRPGILVEKVWAVFPSQQEAPTSPQVVLLSSMPPLPNAPEELQKLFGNPDQEPAEIPVWKLPVQVLINKRALKERYGMDSIPEGTMELHKFIESVIIVMMRKRLDDVFFPPKKSNE